MANTLPEAILEALAGVGEEVSTQMQQNDLLNTNRRDAILRLRAEQEERRRRAADEQMYRNKMYDLEVDQAKESKRRYDLEADRESQPPDERQILSDWLLNDPDKYYQHHERLAGIKEGAKTGKKPSARTPFSSFFQQGGGNKRAMLNNMRGGSLGTGVAGATMQAVQATGVQPTDPNIIGKQKYDDWDQLPDEVKQALIQEGFPD